MIAKLRRRLRSARRATQIGAAAAFWSVLWDSLSESDRDDLQAHVGLVLERYPILRDSLRHPRTQQWVRALLRGCDNCGAVTGGGYAVERDVYEQAAKVDGEKLCLGCLQNRVEVPLSIYKAHEESPFGAVVAFQEIH